MDKEIEILKGYSPDERNEVLECYRGLRNSENPPRQMLAWGAVIEMGNNGLVRFGAHTAGHEILDQLPSTFAENEISQSKDDIERRLGARVTTFAYPNGNHNKGVREIIKGCGFDCAVTTSKGFLGRDTPPLEIPRIGIHQDVSRTIPMYRSRIIFKDF